MLKIDNAVKSYKDFRLNCSLEVQPGRVTGLIGRNGAGKTTLFKAVLNLISLESGRIELFGKEIKEFDSRDKEKIGVVLADSSFSNLLAARDIIPVLENLYSEFDKARFVDLCSRLQIPLKKPVKEMSTGMKAKLKTIIALTHGASLLILDEFTAGMDVIAREELLGLLREFMEKDEDNAILISSHISSDLESLCDDFYMIHEGEILLHEETDVLLGRYGILKVDESQYESLDKQYLLKVKKETFGYRCLTGQKQFYLDNYPELVLEKATIDELMVMMIQGEA